MDIQTQKSCDKWIKSQSMRNIEKKLQVSFRGFMIATNCNSEDCEKLYPGKGHQRGGEQAQWEWVVT